MISSKTFDYSVNRATLRVCHVTVTVEYLHPPYRLYCAWQLVHLKGGFFLSNRFMLPRQESMRITPAYPETWKPCCGDVHQRQTEKYRGVKQAHGARPTMLNQMPKGRLESRPTLTDTD